MVVLNTKVRVLRHKPLRVERIPVVWVREVRVKGGRMFLAGKVARPSWIGQAVVKRRVAWDPKRAGNRTKIVGSPKAMPACVIVSVVDSVPTHAGLTTVARETVVAAKLGTVHIAVRGSRRVESDMVLSAILIDALLTILHVFQQPQRPVKFE